MSYLFYYYARAVQTLYSITSTTPEIFSWLPRSLDMKNGRIARVAHPEILSSDSDFPSRIEIFQTSFSEEQFRSTSMFYYRKRNV